MTSDFSSPIEFGRTGLRVGPLGISSGYNLGGRGAEMAFERGQNFMHFSSRQDPEFIAAVSRFAATDRDSVVIAIHSYARTGFLLRRTVLKALRNLGVDHVDFLFMGYYQRAPSKWLLNSAMKMKDQGLVRHLGISTHKRQLFQSFTEMGIFDAYMVRYNAAHPGAEREVFDKLPPASASPAILAFTTTRWGQFLDPARMPEGEAVPSSSDCYRFALSHPRVDMALTGASNSSQMQQALAALEAGPMSAEELVRMRRIGDHLHEHHKSRILEQF